MKRCADATAFVLPAVASTVAGVLGLPFIPLPSRAGGDETHELWAGFSRQLEHWSTHDGWRFSGAAWFYFAIALGLLGFYNSLRADERDGGTAPMRSSVRYALPPTMVLAAGVLAQFSLGLPWDNYAAGGPIGAEYLLLSAAAIGFWAGLTAFAQIRFAVRRSS
jgi:hypothetical protein